MAINFPNSPSNGDIFGNYTYDSSIPGWRKNPENAASLPAGTIVQWPGATAPANWLLADGSAVSRTTYASLFAAIGVQYGSGDGTSTFNLPNLKGKVAVGLDSSQTEFNFLGETGGAKTHTLITAEMPSHTHGTVAHSHTFSGTTSGESGHSHTAYGISTPSGSGAGYLALQTDSNLVWYRGNGTNWASGGGSGGSRPSVNVGGDMSTSTSGSTGHTHTYSGSTSNAAPDTQSVGSGSPHNNLQPYIVLNYIIKTSAGVTSADSELATRLAAVENKFDIGQNDAPAGSITQFAGSTIPTNWLLCDGSAVSRSTWPSLFSAIGTTYGVGNGTTTFNLPDIPNGDAAGIISTLRINSQITVTTTLTDLSGLSSTVALKAGRTYRITFSSPNLNMSNTGRSRFDILANGTLIARDYVGVAANIGGVAFNVQTLYTPSVDGSYVIKVAGMVDAGTATTMTVYGDLASTTLLNVEDMGESVGSALRTKSIIKATAGVSTNDGTFVTRVGATESNIDTLQTRTTSVESKIGFNASTTFTASTTWTVPTLANKIVKVTVVGAGGGGGWDGQNVGGTGGTSTFSAASGSVSAAGGGRGAGATGNATGAPSTAGLASGNNGSGRGADNNAVNIGGPGTGGKISIGYINLSGVSTASITIGAPGTAGGVSATAGGRGEIIVEYGV